MLQIGEISKILGLKPETIRYYEKERIVSPQKKRTAHFGNTAYCKAIFERYKDKVKYWLTFNEINSGTMAFGSVLSTGTVKGSVPLQRSRTSLRSAIRPFTTSLRPAPRRSSTPTSTIPSSRWAI